MLLKFGSVIYVDSKLTNTLQKCVIYHLEKDYFHAISTLGIKYRVENRALITEIKNDDSYFYGMKKGDEYIYAPKDSYTYLY